MITSPIEYQEAVEFEIYLLDKMLPVVDRDQSSSIDFRGARTVHTDNLSENLCGSAIDRLINELAPLLFGAAWKVLDISIEYALNDAALTADQDRGMRWSIKQKTIHALTAAGSHTLLTQDNSVWEAVNALYANTVEHRHCLVHRTASVDSTSGTLFGRDKDGVRLSNLSLDDQKACARIALLVADGILTGGISSRCEDHLRYWLDRVCSHTNKPMFRVGKKGPPVTIFTTLSENDGNYAVHVEHERQVALKSFLEPQHFDVVFDLPDGSGRQLRARLEDIPPDKTAIDLENLPNWLSFV